MKVKFILPALTEARSPLFRPIKYSLFPPLGLANLAGYLDPDDEVTLDDEHVETLAFDDEPDLVVIQVYITSAYRSYKIADHYRSQGAFVALGGLHVTSLPDEAAQHADAIFLGPRRRHLAGISAGLSLWPPKKTLPVENALTAGHPAHPARSDQAPSVSGSELRHFAYAAAWKKFEAIWNFIIRTKRVAGMLPLLEAILNGTHEQQRQENSPPPPVSVTHPEDRGLVRIEVVQEKETTPVFEAVDLFDR